MNSKQPVKRSVFISPSGSNQAPKTDTPDLVLTSATGSSVEVTVKKGSAPKGRPISSTHAGTTPDATRTRDAIESLRNGTALDAAGIAAIAEGINLLFEQLRDAWAGKKYFVAQDVFLFDDADPNDPRDVDNHMQTYLCFRRQDRGWNFVIEERHSQDTNGESVTLTPLASAPLDVRVRAVEALPQLEAALRTASELQRKSLLKAYDTLSAFVRKALAGDQEGGRGNG